MLTILYNGYRSTAQYKYQEVQDIINKGNGETEVEKDLFMLYNVACHLFHRRYHKEAMSLERQYLEFDEPSNPESITINFKPSIRKIVKEFLFMANTCVAQKISSQYPDQALLRRQAPPNQRKIVSDTQKKKGTV
jgi:protein SSD1